MRKLLTILVLVLGCFGAAQESRAQACPGVAPWVFDDVLASDTFCSYVTWMAQEGVSLGCTIIDANRRLYCPDNNVTRKQMAAFMFRLGEALLPSTCTAGQVLKWNGLQWACANDNTGGVGTVTSVAAGTGLTGGTITGSGTIAADTTYLQRRVVSGCAVGSSIRTINADGSVVCQVDSAGAGTVTSVTATGGGGLATTPGGGISTSGSVGIASGGVQTAMLADNAVTTAKIADSGVTYSKIASGVVSSIHVNRDSIQLRVATTCPRGVPMIGVASDGSPICDHPARTLGFGTNRVSVAIRSDGRPLLARDGGNLHDCADARCTSGTDVILNLGNDVAMALRSDDRPVITAGNGFSQVLVICGDVACTPGGRVVRTLDTGSLYVFSGIALRPDNTPVISYFEGNSGQTRLYVCADPTCASGTVRSITSGPSSTPSGVKVRPNGSPVLALRNYFSGGHSLYDCNDAVCSSGNLRALGVGGSLRFVLGLAVRADNRAIVVNFGPVMHDCADASCSTNVARAFDAGESVVASAAVIRASGLPLLAYGTQWGAVKIFDCADAGCSFGTARTLDQTDTSLHDREIAIALRPDGRPVVAYPTNGVSAVRLLMCETEACR